MYKETKIELGKGEIGLVFSAIMAAMNAEEIEFQTEWLDDKNYPSAILDKTIGIKGSFKFTDHTGKSWTLVTHNKNKLLFNIENKLMIVLEKLIKE